MDINKMTRKQFEELPYLDEFEDHNLRDVDVDSIVLLPSKKHHDSGYNYYEVVVCHRHRAIGRCYGYDTFSIYMESNFNRVGIDCLRGPGLMRIFLPPNEYKAVPMFHEIRIDPMKKKESVDRFVKNVENLCSNDLKPMWDKWQEEMTKQIKETLKGEEDG